MFDPSLSNTYINQIYTRPPAFLNHSITAPRNPAPAPPRSASLRFPAAALKIRTPRPTIHHPISPPRPHTAPTTHRPAFPPRHRRASLSDVRASGVALPPLVVPATAPATDFLGSLCRSLPPLRCGSVTAPATAPGSARACRPRPRALSRSPRTSPAARAKCFARLRRFGPFLGFFRWRLAQSSTYARPLRAAPPHSLGSGLLICVHYSPPPALARLFRSSDLPTPLPKKERTSRRP